MTPTSVVVRRFAPADQHAARALILEGMRDHSGFIDDTLNRDLDDIELSYADGVFLVAEQDRDIVATGALVPRDDDCGEVVRMSTLRDHRRRGIARSLLRALIDEARALNHVQVRLDTNIDWTDAIAFYDRCGMIRVPDPYRGAARFELTL